MNVAIVGCGLMGQKRARALAGCELIACADLVLERAESLARSVPGSTAYRDWRAAVDRPDVDIVVVSTTHNMLAEITSGAILAGKHVLVEKPAARRAAELDPLIVEAEKAGVAVRVGFNHRYHPAFRQARLLLDSGAVGELLYVRGRYGHGGRLGYDTEWRAQPDLSGGGVLIDQGVHLIDLARWVLGEIVGVDGYAQTYFWKMPVEDNGFLLLKTARSQVAFLHMSCTEWKNQFSFEIVGSNGKLEVTGLGGSYGIERLAFYHKLPQMGPPETTIWEYPMADNSWEVEFTELVEDIRINRQPSANLHDARAALAIVESIYARSTL